MKNNISTNTRKLVLLAVFTAIVVVLQMLASVLPFFPFTLTLVLVPIVIAVSVIGIYAGAWLGFVFGFVVLIMNQALLFLSWNAPATVFVVLLKGTLAGLASGLVYKFLEKKSKTFAVIAASAVCPVVNTGIFVLGSYIFFLPDITAWAESMDYSNATTAIFIGFINMNFPFEFLISMVLSPVIIRLIKYRQKSEIH